MPAARRDPKGMRRSRAVVDEGYLKDEPLGQRWGKPLFFKCL